VVGDVYRGRRMRLSISMWLHAGGKASLSLCGRIVSHTMRRVLITSRRTRHLQKRLHVRRI
jgi:hypothetical protein